jgi:hypothetical protein
VYLNFCFNLGCVSIRQLKLECPYQHTSIKSILSVVQLPMLIPKTNKNIKSFIRIKEGKHVFDVVLWNMARLCPTFSRSSFTFFSFCRDKQHRARFQVRRHGRPCDRVGIILYSILYIADCAVLYIVNCIIHWLR